MLKLSDDLKHLNLKVIKKSRGDRFHSPVVVVEFACLIQSFLYFVHLIFINMIEQCHFFKKSERNVHGINLETLQVRLY